jgi:hypothetical protein
MNEDTAMPCFCIISHPTAPKFLVTRHADGIWGPPTVPVAPRVPLSSQIDLIIKQINERYGLRVTVLRHVFEGNQQCVELEMRGRQQVRDFKAVWVGRKEFEQFRSSEPGQRDALASWLMQADEGDVPDQRPPWSRRGWFSVAENWIHHELNMRNIQVTGSVRQFRSLWHASAILRVKTSEGFVFFKASHLGRPREVELTVKLNERWPEFVPLPLAVDLKKNWMLSRDYSSASSGEELTEDFGLAAAAMGQLQIESTQDLDYWKSLGCPQFDLEDLSNFLARIGEVSSLYRGGRKPLSVEDIPEIEARAARLSDKCHELNSIGIPSMLVHPDFRAGNLFRKKTGYWAIDWADLKIGHPFLSMAYFVDYELNRGRGIADLPAADPGEMDGQLTPLIRAYLEPFSDYVSGNEAVRAFVLARQLHDAWAIHQMITLIDTLEPESPDYRRWLSALRKRVRNGLMTQQEPI